MTYQNRNIFTHTNHSLLFTHTGVGNTHRSALVHGHKSSQRSWPDRNCMQRIQFGMNLGYTIYNIFASINSDLLMQNSEVNHFVLFILNDLFSSQIINVCFWRSLGFQIRESHVLSWTFCVCKLLCAKTSCLLSIWENKTKPSVCLYVERCLVTSWEIQYVIYLKSWCLLWFS